MLGKINNYSYSCIELKEHINQDVGFIYVKCTLGFQLSLHQSEDNRSR